jgi:acyl-CoA synthetase (AMP-forming)/AMP-acid ligase II
VYRFAARSSSPAFELRAGELDQACRSIGRALADRHPAGGFAMLLLPPGRPFVLGFLGCQYAGLVPVPVAPPAKSRVEQSLAPARRVAVDCAPVAVLSTLAARDGIFPTLAPEDPLSAPAWEPVEDLLTGDASAWLAPSVPAGSLALLQYTSGSVTTPRGVEVTGANLLRNLEVITRAFATTPEDHAVVWLPPHHDMGLIGGLLTPLYGGFDVTLLHPNDVVQAPVRWLKAITEHGGTISGGPDFGYRLCAERVRDEHLEGVDLNRWRLAFTGAEPISAATLDRFAERFAPVGFDPSALYPCYGLAEATLLVTGGTAGAGARRILVSRDALARDGVAHEATDPTAGRPMVSNGRSGDEEAELLIVDPERAVAVPEGHVGEIWLRGPCVARGYHGNEVATREAFAARLADGTGPYLRTGDLGVLVDGELYVTGRSKDVVIAQGRNLDAHDVEAAAAAALSEHRHGLTLALGDVGDAGERLVIVQELGRADAADQREVTRLIRAAVADLVSIRPEVVLVPVGSLPRTTSGKLRRAEGRRLHEQGGLGRTARDQREAVTAP